MAPASGARTGDGSGSRARTEVEPATENRAPSAGSPDPPEQPETSEPSDPEAAVATDVASIELERVVELWPAVVGHLRESGEEMLSTLFEGARPLGINEERSMLRIGFPASAKFNKRKAEAPANVERMTETIHAITGVRLRPAYELTEEESGEVGEDLTKMSDDDLIEMIKTNFDAREIDPDEARESEAG